jgi:L-rhamnose-H+ transport protein
MQSNPFIGVILHATGGLAAASFYLPYKRIRRWNWEIYWILGGVFSWLIAPIAAALIILAIYYRFPLMQLFKTSPIGAIIQAFTFGMLWGVGGLTFGLSMRYLGIALGCCIALGFCAAFGTLLPPLVEGTFPALIHTSSGRVILIGIVMCLVGIAVSGVAGISKERELSQEQKQAAVEEFNFIKGLGVATFCGLLSACMSFALSAGHPIAQYAIKLGAPDLWSGLPVLVIILLGGLLSNAIWCAALIRKNKSLPEVVGLGRAAGISKAALALNFLLAAAGGITWYLQFFFYTMGASLMGRKYGFSSWTLHMSTIIIFSTIWGILLREWKGSSLRTYLFVAVGLVTLIFSTVIIGYGNFLATEIR